MEYERTREQLDGILNNGVHGWRAENQLIKDEVLAQILSLDGIEIRADSQDLPLAGPFSLGEAENVRRARSDMLKPDSEGKHWVEVIPKPKRK